MKKILLFVITVCLLKSLQAQYSPNSMLDTAFGIEGKVITPLSSDKYQSCYIKNVIVQPDGKFIVAGTVYNLHGNSQIILVRYFANGKIDSSFGISGYTFAGVANSENILRSAGLQSDGKIIVVMEYQQYISSTSNFIDTFGLVKFTANGQRDISFGKRGFLSLKIPSYSVAIDENDNIFVGGQTPDYKKIPGTFSVQKFFKNGGQSQAFGDSGTAKISFSQAPTFYIFPVVTIDKNGNILLANSAQVNGIYENFVVVRFTKEGLLDSSFNKKGWNSVNYNNTQDIVYSIALQDNNIIVGGSESTTTADNFMLARFKANGSLDTGFGNSGIIIKDFSTDSFNNREDLLTTVLVQKNNKIIATGTTIPSTYNYGRFVLIRYNANGSVDSSFGNKGQVITLFGNNNAECQAAALQADDKILAVGNSNPNNIAIARYLKDKQAKTIAKYLAPALQYTTSLKLSPNPVKNLLTIKGISSSNDYQFSISNENGVVVLSKKISNTSVCDFNVSRLQNGIYYLNITNYRGNEKLMFLKE